MNIIISGLGIIGGSFAKALAKYTDHHIIGIIEAKNLCKMLLPAVQYTKLAQENPSKLLI